MRRTTIALALALAASCSPPAGQERGGGRSTIRGFEGTERGVVVFPAYLSATPDGAGSFGTLSPDVVVRLGEARGEWREVAVEGDLPVTGWVRSERLGCRAVLEIALEPLDGEAAVAATLRPGARLAVLGREEGGMLTVETRHPVVRRGRIRAEDCSVGERFVPTLPRDGTLFVVGREARLLSSSGEPTATLGEGERFVVLGSPQGGYATGRTDGPVVVGGRIDATALEEDPRTTPLDRLAEPLGYTHETLVEERLLDSASGSTLALLPGGCPLNVLETRGDWSRVSTVGPVELQGWVPHGSVRRVALDHNELDPGARRREHAPIDRALPRAVEEDEP